MLRVRAYIYDIKSINIHKDIKEGDEPFGKEI